MVTANGFRRIALGMKDAVESAHMGHPDFRVHGRIFATIHADQRAGMVKLTPEQQEDFIRDHPGTFAPEAGAWGRAGCTQVRFDAVNRETLGEALTVAWQNVARAAAATGSKPSRPRTPASRATGRRSKTR